MHRVESSVGPLQGSLALHRQEMAAEEGWKSCEDAR